MAANTANVDRMREQLFFGGEDRGAKLSRFWLLLLLASVIAAAGVVADSTATVIGAMIVAPLMTPILGCVLGVVLADRDNLARCAVLVITGAAAVVAIGYLIGISVELPVVAATNSQVAGRVAPRLIDLVAALATGAVGSIALARDDISDTLPGVAIAISLVPPLAVVGLALESGAPAQALGALLLFITNVSAILATGLLVMGIYRFYRTTGTQVERGLRRGRATGVIVGALIVIAVPLTLSSARATHISGTEATVNKVASDWAHADGWEIVSVSTRPDGLLVRAIGPEPQPDTKLLRSSLREAGLRSSTVRLELVPATTDSLDLGD